MKPNFIVKPRENPFRALSYFHEPGKKETVTDFVLITIGLVLQFKPLLYSSRIRGRVRANGFREQKRSKEDSREDQRTLFEIGTADYSILIKRV
jgi:hypothetical protein